MTIKRLPRCGLAMIVVLALSAPVFAQVQPVVQNRIPQQVIINGQRVNGAYVPAANGGMQTFTCSAPQYVTPDSASQGWACFDQATNVWLLNALPPATQTVQQAPAPVQPPTVVYPQPPAVIYQQPGSGNGDIRHSGSRDLRAGISPWGCAWDCGDQCGRPDRERRDSGFPVPAGLLRRAWLPAMVI